MRACFPPGAIHLAPGTAIRIDSYSTRHDDAIRHHVSSVHPYCTSDPFVPWQLDRRAQDPGRNRNRKRERDGRVGARPTCVRVWVDACSGSFHEREGSCSRIRKGPFQTHRFPPLPQLRAVATFSLRASQEALSPSRLAVALAPPAPSRAARGRASRPANLPCPLSPHLVPHSLYRTGLHNHQGPSIHPSTSESHTARACVRSPAQPRDIDLHRPSSDPIPLDRARPVSTSLSSSMAAMPTDSMTRRFAVACGVLGQYVRNGSGGAPSTMTPPPAPFLKQAPAAGPAAASAPQQLTIFYGGRVVVLDACPPEKAAELIRLAAKGGPQPPEQALVDMPIARKASLRRFLAKRKDRSSSSSASPAPYDDRQDDEPPAPKKGKMAAATREEPSSSSWLALGSLCSMHSR